VTPTLLSYTGPVFDQKQIQWWGKSVAAMLRKSPVSCAPSPKVPRRLPQDFEKTWVSQWGTGQVSEPLLGIKGVVLQKELPTKADDPRQTRDD